MKIAQVAPLYESVPPRRYGGTERVVHMLTEELVRQGHEVTLFASGDSRTSAELRPICPVSLWHNPETRDTLAPHVLEIETVLQEVRRFDVIHSHIDYLPFPSFRRVHVPVVHTLHGRLDIPELRAVFEQFGDALLVSISDAQRRPFPTARWVRTIHHGLPSEALHKGDGAGGYLAFLGRFSRDKGPHTAIEVARRCGMKIKIAGKICEDGRKFYETTLEPMMRDPLVEFVGEIDDAQKQDFLGRAAALLFPIEWPEPFGIVIIEAMACGTPVIATGFGSVPEIVEPGVNGMICSDVDEMVAAVESLPAFDRAACRESFERKFTSERMVNDYLEVYRSVIFAGSGIRLVRPKTDALPDQPPDKAANQ